MRHLLPIVLVACVGAPATDADDTDTTPDTDTDPATIETGETGDVDAKDTDDTDPPPPCHAFVDVEVTGEPLTAHAVDVYVNPFEGLAEDLSNLRVRDPRGASLDRWIAGSRGGGAMVWIAVPSLPVGTTRLVLDACDDTPVGAGERADVFPLWEDFARSDVSTWGPACEGVSDDGEACAAEVVELERASALQLDATSSCEGGSMDGAASRVARQVTLPAGRWVLSLDAWVTGEHTGGCDGAVDVALRVLDRDGEVASTGCDLVQCKACDRGWEPLEAVLTGDGAPRTISVQARVGNCATTRSWLREVWIRQVPDPAPVVTFVGPEAPPKR